MAEQDGSLDRKRVHQPRNPISLPMHVIGLAAAGQRIRLTIAATRPGQHRLCRRLSQALREIAPHRNRAQALMEKEDGHAAPPPPLQFEANIIDKEGRRLIRNYRGHSCTTDFTRPVFPPEYSIRETEPTHSLD